MFNDHIRLIMQLYCEQENKYENLYNGHGSNLGHLLVSSTMLNRFAFVTIPVYIMQIFTMNTKVVPSNNKMPFTVTTYSTRLWCRIISDIYD